MADFIKKINILGTDYMVYKGDGTVESVDYMDKTSKKIVVDSCVNSDLDHPDEYTKLALRHEVIHAFMFESGLDSETEHVKFPEDEIFVDWVAIQYPKIKKVFDELEI